MERRKFVKNSLATAASAIAIPTIVPASVFGKDAPSNKINVGQIGCGRIARDHDMPGTIQHDVARMIAVSDVDSNRMAEGKQRVEEFTQRRSGSDKAVDVKMYADYKDMLADKEIDAVVISTPDHWHSQPALEAVAGRERCLSAKTHLTYY